jgi:hypothetical protein
LTNTAEARAPGQRADVPAELQNLVPDARRTVIRRRSRAAVLTARGHETALFDSLKAIRHFEHQLSVELTRVAAVRVSAPLGPQLGQFSSTFGVSMTWTMCEPSAFMTQMS